MIQQHVFNILRPYFHPGLKIIFSLRSFAPGINTAGTIVAFSTSDTGAFPTTQEYVLCPSSLNRETLFLICKLVPGKQQ